MKISTLVTLNQEELQNIAVSYALEQLNITDAASTSVEFVDDEAGNLQARVSIDTDDAAGEPKSSSKEKAPAKAPGKRGRKTAAAEPEAEKIETAEPEAETTAEVKAEADVPWTEDQTEAETKEEASEEKTEAAPVAASTAPKIFQDLKTSAAPSTKPELPANPTKNSLFANLTRPVNGAH